MQSRLDHKSPLTHSPTDASCPRRKIKSTIFTAHHPSVSKCPAYPSPKPSVPATPRNPSRLVRTSSSQYVEDPPSHHVPQRQPQRRNRPDTSLILGIRGPRRARKRSTQLVRHKLPQHVVFPAIIPHLHHRAGRNGGSQVGFASQRKSRSEFLEDGRADGGDVEVAGESEHAAEEGAGVLKKAGGGGDLGTRAVVRDDGKGALFHPLDDVETGAGVAVSCDESVGRSLRSGVVGNLFTSDGGVVKEQAFRQRKQFGLFADVEGGGGSPAKPLGGC